MADVSDGQQTVNQTEGVPALPDDIINAAKLEIEKAMSGALSQATILAKGDASTSQSEDDMLYVEPIQDPYGKAIKYLEQHNILQLFQVLTSNIVYHKPDDPLGFMMKEIKTMKDNRKDSSESNS